MAYFVKQFSLKSTDVAEFGKKVELLDMVLLIIAQATVLIIWSQIERV